MDKIRLVVTFFLASLFLPLVIQTCQAAGETTYSPSSNFGVWVNPNLAYSSDDNRAFAFLDHQKHEYGDYNVSILEGEEISKVEVGVEHYEDAADRAIGVRVSWDGGTSWSSQAKVFNYQTEGMDWIDATNVTDWTEDKLNNTNFVVEVEYFHSSGCFGNDVLITMANGEYETIRGLSKGDRVMRADGGQQIVTRYDEHDDMPPILMFNVTVADGRSLIIHPDHDVVVSLDYDLVQVANLTLQHSLLSRNGSMISIVSIEYLWLGDMANIVVSNQLFWAEDLLVHNLVKIPYSAYLDWLPVQITTSEAGPEEYTITFNFYDGGYILVNGSAKSNGSSAVYDDGAILNLTGVKNKTGWSLFWMHKNFTFLNRTTSTDSPYYYTVNETDTVDTYFQPNSPANLAAGALILLVGVPSAAIIIFMVRRKR